MHSTPLKVTEMLIEFEALFGELRGLPPKRIQDHAITLKNGAHPPNLRPYRYPYFQKNEIKWIVQEMMTVRVIRPSVSPFASPVIWSRKRIVDGGFVQIIMP